MSGEEASLKAKLATVEAEREAHRNSADALDELNANQAKRIAELEKQLAEAKQVVERLMVYPVLHEQQHPEWNGNRFDDMQLAKKFLSEQGEGKPKKCEHEWAEAVGVCTKCGISMSTGRC